VIVQRVMLFRCSSRGLCVAHPPVLLLDNVGYHHSESVEDCAAEIGEELFVVAARFPWFNPVEAVCSVLSCSCFAHGSIVMSVAYVTTIFHKSCAGSTSSELLGCCSARERGGVMQRTSVS